MFPTLPNDVSLLIVSKTGPLYEWARFSRISRAWRNALAAHVARITPSDEFYKRLVYQLRLFNLCGLATCDHLQKVKLREQLQQESITRFASICMLLDKYETLLKKQRPYVNFPLMGRLHKAFKRTFTKRGALRTVITWLRHERRLSVIGVDRPLLVALIGRKRAGLEKSEQRLAAMDTRRGDLTQKKRKIEEKLGLEQEG
jgi:hypothetical protein